MADAANLGRTPRGGSPGVRPRTRPTILAARGRLASRAVASPVGVGSRRVALAELQGSGCAFRLDARVTGVDGPDPAGKARSERPTRSCQLHAQTPSGEIAARCAHPERRARRCRQRGY